MKLSGGSTGSGYSEALRLSAQRFFCAAEMRFRAAALRTRGLHPRGKQHGLFTFARHCCQDHGTAQPLAPATPTREQGSIRSHIELEVAAHHNVARAGLTQALSVFLGLRQHQLE